MDKKKLIPWTAFFGAILLTLAGALAPSSKDGFATGDAVRLPVLEGGRVKPLDSVARNSLLMIRSKQTVRQAGESIGADRWILDLMLHPDLSDRQPVFVIDDPDVLGLLGQRQSSNRYYDFEAIQPHLDELQKQAQAASAIPAQKRTRFQSAVATLFSRVYLYYRLKNSIQLEGSEGLAGELIHLQDPAAVEHHAALAQWAAFRPLPPLPGQKADAWMSIGEALKAAGEGQPVHPGLLPWARFAAAWKAGNAPAFNGALAEIEAVDRQLAPAATANASREALFNRIQPFYAGIVIYGFAFLLLALSWLGSKKILLPSAFGLLCAGALVHTGGLLARIILQGRPPVTNLYSSAIFVGWAVVVLGLILERIHRRGFGLAVASAVGFTTLIVAQNLGTSGDTMEMMRAVLDSNFWLATHVVTITIGYSGTFLAGSIAVGYTFWKHLAPKQDPETGKALLSMAYGIICFSLLFSFVGTVLGGIWADQSWGRFWGWDPKENGALLIVLWNAIILHARWAGYIRERGIMACAIFGNVITSLSWFGVNLLGVGLHSYGFTNDGLWWLVAFIASQLLLMGLCLAPRRFWELPPQASA
ncbi:MAG TPA: cytochrome c biogenesis protein CcsA [Holophagaceae bacterium]|nr:cytochrome c biogenesis protein CcsA [Holophagaceae bacterium]